MKTNNAEVYDWIDVIIYARDLGFTPAEVKDIIRQIKNGVRKGVI